MKFCQNCGNQCSAVNGLPAKFCGECGEPLGGATRATAKTEAAPAKTFSFEDIKASDMFSVAGDGSQKMSFEDLAKDKEKSSGSGRGKGNTSIQSIKANTTANIQIDA